MQERTNIMRRRCRRLVTAFALTSMLLPRLPGATVGPDGAGYTATNAIPYSFVNIAGTGAGLMAGSDDARAPVNLGFVFRFYGQDYSAVCISTNGLLQFGACNPVADFANQDLSGVPPPAGLPTIAPLWADLSFAPPGSGAVFYQTSGAAGSRVFIVQWNNVFPVNVPVPVTFQAILSESSNQILFQYQTVDVGAGYPARNGGTATVGISDGTGNATGRRLQWSYAAPALGNGTAIQFGAAGAATVPVVITTAPAGLKVLVDGVSYTAPASLNWPSGSRHSLGINSPQTQGGVRSTFSSWSNGGPAFQTVSPSAAATYTAAFSAEYGLTTRVSPPGGGTITPSAWYAPGAQVTVSATAAAGYRFEYFSGDLSGGANPQGITMTGPRNVVANFAALAPSLIAAVTGKSGAPAARQWKVQLTDNGPGTATDAQLTGMALTQVFGSPCSPAASLGTSLPVPFGTIAPGGAATANITINFAGCPAGARFSVQFTFRANGGSYSGTTTLNNQFP